MFLLRTWNALQISHSGHYSVERCNAFKLYQKRASLARAITVCVLTPFPSLIFVLLVEACLPLAPIADGYFGSANLCIRLCIATIVIGFCFCNLTRRFIPELRISQRHFVLPAIATGIAHTAVVSAYTLLWVYPLPFATAQTSMVFMVLLFASVRVFIGGKPFRSVPDWQRQLKVSITIVTITNSLTLLYPAFSMLFQTQKNTFQSLLVIVPFIFKLFTKAHIATLCRAIHHDQFIPEIVHFGVELSHALYITTCMQTATQPLQTICVVVLFDFVPLAYSYRRIRSVIAPGTSSGSQPSLSALIGLAQVAPQPPLPRPPGPQQDENTTSSPVTGPHMPTTREGTHKGRPSSHYRQALYACENHLLVEYIECVIPLVYAIYIAVLFHLPNAKYYGVMLAMDTQERVVAFMRNVLLLVALQFASVVAFGTMVSRQQKGKTQKISCLYVLAFVLDTQWEMVQGWLFMWVPFCILSMVKHAGVDFTLRFEWIGHRPPT